MKLNTDYFQTRDLYFSSYLFAKEYDLIQVKNDETGRFYWFIFENKSKCEQEEKRFMKNKAIVKAKNYAEAVKYLKRKVSQ